MEAVKFKKVKSGATLYCDGQPVTVVERYFAMALCETKAGKTWITCYDLESKK